MARARTSRIALLCAEEDPARCHRHLLIGPVLQQRGVPVCHIRRDGRTETEADLAARGTGGTAADPQARGGTAAGPQARGRTAAGRRQE